jgi:hypothetical protein
MGPEKLPGDLEPELIETAEGGQVRAGEGNVRHVEVFQMGGIRTSIIGRPRRLPALDAPTRATPSIVKSLKSPRGMSHNGREVQSARFGEMSRMASCGRAISDRNTFSRMKGYASNP